ncbi:MAG: 1-(5-phosphoribosyl)-5-[(5-phosphoribosylamino)methylideneamino]imidazole-4-carboxamide isomerase [SAR202 cluster bacterium]|nr:1-(5-phosphoribosyl)-5-[(5-phosphoribosylamino)methylideneamino]imidazole-4-carboxamide isomerase [SAR202 cluster bacterium]
MEVVPAIDLRGGRCVRLYQGDYSRETLYSGDPVAVALRWVEEGATRLHVVDLDGARAGVPANLDAVAKIAAAAGVPIQLGGGIRTLESAKAVADRGVDRVILGTAALETPDLVKEVCGMLGSGRVIVSVDAKDGYVVVRGWEQASRTTALSLAKRVAGWGVLRIMYTDVSRDGTLTEPNFEGVQQLVDGSGLAAMAAGGISSIGHLKRLALLGAEAAIVGKALYTGGVDLRSAIRETGAISAKRV